MSKQRQRKAAQTKKSRQQRLYALAIGGLLLALLVLFFILRPGGEQPTQSLTPIAQLAPTAMPTPTSAPLGGVTACRHSPRFITALEVGPRAALGTSVSGITGLAIVDPDGDNGTGSIYQHESWDDAGSLGPWVYDRAGNVYTAAAPLVSLVENPPEDQNKIYRVDTDSQTMAELLDLPPALPPSGANPFGVVGLAYDCETEHLYATSLMGSTAADEVGRIFQIDLESGEMMDQLEGIDAMGVAVFNGRDGKRLYYGLTRRPEVWSIPLDAAGHFAGEPQMVLSLAGLDMRGNDVVRRIDFTPGPNMLLRTMDFNYSLQIASQRDESRFEYVYDPENDGWTLSTP